MPFLVLLLACAQPAVDPWTPPDTPGPYAAAVDEDEGTTSGGLGLPLLVWYPSDAPDDDPVEYGGLLVGGAADGGPAACEQARPVVVFSHGNGGVGYQSFFFTERLATRGWVVVAPDHVGNTTFDMDTVPRAEVAVRRPADVAAAFDRLVERSSTPGDRLAGCVDPEAGYAVIGHSFGGFTALATAGARVDLAGLDAICPGGDWLCGTQDALRALDPDTTGDLSDARAWAMAAWAPAARASLDSGAVDVPALVVAGIADTLTTWDDEVRPIWEELSTTPRRLAAFDDVGHYTFTDFCVEGAFPGCDDDGLPIAQAQALITTITTAFLDVTRGESRSADMLPIDSPWLQWEEVLP